MSPQYGEQISRLDRVTRILESLMDQSQPQSLTRIAEATRIPKSSVQRTLAEMARFGWLDRLGNDYEIGGFLRKVAARTSQDDLLIEIAQPHIVDLFGSVRETVTLARIIDSEAICLWTITDYRHCACELKLGLRFPLHCTGLGKALLAHATDAQISSVVSLGLPRTTPSTISRADFLYRELEGIRDNGLALDREENKKGVACMAAPILDPRGTAIAAISISTPRDRFNIMRIEAGVRKTALAISSAIRSSMKRNEQSAS